VSWLDCVDLDACTHKKLRTYAKKAGIAANQSGIALVAALKQHAVSPGHLGPKSAAKQAAEAAKGHAAEAAAALEVPVRATEKVQVDRSTDSGQALQCPPGAIVLSMCPGEHCVVASSTL
jgi:hypothetical protein